MTENRVAIIPPNRVDIENYYDRSEKGYWGFLKGRCHYGFSSPTDIGPFYMEAAQIQMEQLLGQTLNLPPGSTVLDAGCGFGAVARTLTDKFDYQIVGADLIGRRLLAGSALNNEANNNRINLTQGDYHHLPFADASLDGVYTMETLVHAIDHKAVLHEFFRVLKPGGRLALFEYTIPELASVPAPVRKLAERVIQNTGMSSLPKFTHGSFRSILTNAGFVDAESTDISRNVYPSWFHLWKHAINETTREFRQGNISVDAIPGSMWIWPARHQLGYAVSHASKPQ